MFPIYSSFEIYIFLHLTVCSFFYIASLPFTIPSCELFSHDKNIRVLVFKKDLTRGLPLSDHCQWSCSVWPVWPVALLGFSDRLIRSEEGEHSHVDPHDYTQRTLSAWLCNLRDPLQTHTCTHVCSYAKMRPNAQTKAWSLPFLPLSFCYTQTHFYTHARIDTHTIWPALLLFLLFSWNLLPLDKSFGILGADSQNQQWQHTLTLLTERD